MSSNCPPQLHLTIQPSTTSFKRSFEQFGFDLESPGGQDAGGSGGDNGNDRNKRARSASSFSEDSDTTSSSRSSTIASGSSGMSSSSNEVDRAPSPVVPGSSGLATHISHQPPRLPTPAIQDIEMPDYPADAEETESFVTNLAPQDPPQHYRISLDGFDAFESNILRQSHLPRSPTPPPTLPPLSISEEAISADAIPFLHPRNESPSSTRVQSPSTIRDNSTEQGDEDRASWQSFSPQNVPLQFIREPFSISIPMPSRGSTRSEPSEGSSRRPILDESDEAETIAVFRERLDSALEPIRSPSPLVPGLEDDDEVEEEELSPTSVPPDPPTLPPIVTGATDDHWNTFDGQETNPGLRDHPSPFSVELRSWLDDSSYSPPSSSRERAPTNDWAPHLRQHPQFASLVDSNSSNLPNWLNTRLDATSPNSDISPTRSLFERFSTDEAPAITGTSHWLLGRPSTDEAAIRSFDHSAQSQGMNLSRSRSTITHGSQHPFRPPVATMGASLPRPSQTRLHPLMPPSRFPNELRQRRSSRDNTMDTDPPYSTYDPPRPTAEGYPHRLPQTNNSFPDWQHMPRTTSLQRVGPSNSLVTENTSEVRRRTDHAEVVQRLHASSHRNSQIHRRNVGVGAMQREAIDRMHRRLQEQANMLERIRQPLPPVGMPASRPSFSGHTSFESFLSDSYNGNPDSSSSIHDNTLAGSLAAYLSPPSPASVNNDSPSSPPGSYPWFSSRPSWAHPQVQPRSDATTSPMSNDSNAQRRYFDLSTPISAPEIPHVPSSFANQRRQSNHSLEDVFMSEHAEPPSSSHPPSLPSPDLGGTFDTARDSQSIGVEHGASRPERIHVLPSPSEATGRPISFGDLPSMSLASPESPAEENRFSSRHRSIRPPRDPHQPRLTTQQYSQRQNDISNRDRETQRRREHLAAVSRAGEHNRAGRSGPNSTLPRWSGLEISDDSLYPSSMGGSFNPSVGRAAAQPRRTEFQDPTGPRSHPGGDFPDFAPGPFRNTMQQIAMQRRSSRQTPPSIPPLSFGDHDLSSFHSRPGQGGGMGTNSGGNVSQPPRPPYLRNSMEDTFADRAAAAQRRMDIQDFEDRVFTSRSTTAATRADEAMNYHRRQMDLHRYISQQVRMEGSRLDTGSNIRSSSDTPAFSQAIEALRPDTLNTTRSHQLIQRFHRQRESSLDRSGQGLGGPPMPQSRLRRFSRTDASPTRVEPDSSSRLSSGTAEDRPDGSFQEMLDAHLLRHRRGRFARAPPEVLLSFGRLGRRPRALGDYMHDEDFDESYESLISLAATIGEVKPRSTPSEVIASLESAQYQQWATAESDRRCPICLEDYQPTDAVLKLNNCSHWLHKECLKHWLDSANTCPVCRKSVNTTPSAPPTSSGFRRIPQRHPNFLPFFPGAGPGSGPGNNGNAPNGESGRRGWNPPYY